MKKHLLSYSLFLISYSLFSQNVGIGTNAPQSTLDVKGNQRIGGATKYMSYDSVSGKIEWKNSTLFVPGTQQLIQHSASAEGLFYDNGQLEYRNILGTPIFFTNWSTGNSFVGNKLGIGNTNPLNPLSFPPSLMKKISLYPGATGDAGMGMAGNLLQLYSDNINADIGLGYDDYINGFIERMRIKGNGMVGIGNSNPLNPLSFAASLTKKISLFPGPSGDAGLGVDTGLLQIYSDNIDADIGLGFDDHTNGFTERMRIKGNGLVGINNSDPQAMLHISSFGDEALRLDAGSPYLSLYSSGVYKGYVWKGPNSIELGSASGSALPVTIAPNGNPVLYVDPIGNVGINASLPYRKLDIVGSDTTRMMISSTSGFGHTGIEFYSNYGIPNTWRPAYVLSGDNGNFTGRFDVFTNGTGSLEKFGSVHGITVTNGSLGVNTKNPLRALHVEGNTFINGFLGLGNLNPNSPLSFPASLGKKITLYPGGTGDVGFGVAGNRLQVFADNINADVALGYDNSGSFVERFAVKGNGAISVNGNAGSPGQVLQSNGSSAVAGWVYPPGSFNETYMVQGTANIPFAGGVVIDLPGLITTINTGASGATVIISFSIPMFTAFCPTCSPSDGAIELMVNGTVSKSFGFTAVNSTRPTTCSGSTILQLQSNSSIVIKLRGVHFLPSNPFSFSVNTGSSPQASNMLVQKIVL